MFDADITSPSDEAMNIARSIAESTRFELKIHDRIATCSIGRIANTVTLIVWVFEKLDDMGYELVKSDRLAAAK